LSRENTFDADEWIVQAKQLHADIERSRVTAREIVEQHEQTDPIRSKVEDASAKVELIETEIAFNQAVAGTLEVVQRLCQQLEASRASLASGNITAAIEQLEAIQAALGDNTFFVNTNVMSILTIEGSRLRQEIEEAVCLRWSQQLNVDRQKSELRIEKAQGPDSLESTILSLEQLGTFTAVNEKFQQDLITIIIDPILQPRRDGNSHTVTVTEAGIHLDSETSKAAVAETLDRITRVLDYLRQNLPSSISDTIPQSFLPAVASKTISGWLSPAIPTDLSGLDKFEETLELVLQLTKTIESWGWSGHEELSGWVNQAARLWLARRRVDSLDRVRKVLAASTGSTKQVERVEKETVTQADEALLENANTDDWDAEWDDDKEEPTTGESATHTEEDEEDVSAWGLDDDAQEDAKPQPTASTNDDDDADDADDAWGWGEDEEDSKDEQNDQSHTTPSSKPTKEKNNVQPPTEKEVVLREVYTVTDIPESVLRIVQQQITDSKDISQPP
jgi:centromere/kinetochore protein ZW10